MVKYTLEESRNFYNNVPGKRVSAAMIILNADNQCLMVKANYKSNWTFPGGIVNENESPKAGAIRETHEEVGIFYDDENVEFKTVNFLPELEGFKDWVHFFFQAPIYKNEAIKLQADEIEDYDWVELDQIASKSQNRSRYVIIQDMLLTGKTEYYMSAEEI